MQYRIRSRTTKILLNKLLFDQKRGFWNSGKIRINFGGLMIAASLPAEPRGISAVRFNLPESYRATEDCPLGLPSLINIRFSRKQEHQMLWKNVIIFA